MTSLKCDLHLTCLCLWTTTLTTMSLHQESGFVSVNVGDSVTLRCFYEDEFAAAFYWYKQILGQKPRLISRFFKHDKKGTFYHEFMNNQRFTLDTEKESITVNVKGSGLDIPVLVHQSASETIQPGGSVTLNCTVHTGTCEGEHSVYWFKRSEDSPQALIYTHGGRNDQCERRPDTQTHSCVYNLPMNSLNISHVGTYYCAVATCGHILFGNGTKLDIENEVNPPDSRLYFLSGALVFCTILVVFLTFSVYNLNKRNRSQCTAESQRASASTTTNGEGYQDADNLHYAALRDYRVSRSRRQRDNTETECVYSSVRQ
uniref:uncharacterized protein LOC124055051 isoform X3 n=1 Tax=Scatophagus argus TaxID=75038 RepID=UPI001ED841F6|nr:uncharacterized protein LOC124055051 isoform X3 [Scatophagus argus]